MPVLAQLAVAAAVYAIDRPYSYRVPEDMPLQAGMRVLVPFGRGNRRTEGVVLSLQTGDAAGLKTVERMLDDAPILTGGQLRVLRGRQGHSPRRVLVRRKENADARIRRAG